VKLLFDQNLSFRLKTVLAFEFPESVHIAALRLETADDSEIWKYAKTNGFTIVTQDADYYELALMRGIPPKIIWVRSGNTSTKYLQNLFLQKVQKIKDFIGHAESICLEIF